MLQSMTQPLIEYRQVLSNISSELQLNRTNSSDTEASFLDELVHNKWHFSSKIYDKRDDLILI